MVKSLIDCDDVISSSSSPFLGECNNKWYNLKPMIKPTQAQIGYAWVQYKLDKNFNSMEDAQDELDGEEIPAVVGPDNYMYIIDKHHTLSALDFSDYDDILVTLYIICDYRNISSMEAFWSYLEQENLVYLASHPDDDSDQLPRRIKPSDLPRYFCFTSQDKVFSDDPWRSLASYSRKVKDPPDTPSCPEDGSKYCMRCMYRGCVDGYQMSGPGVPFFEFQWAYMMLDASMYSADTWWPSQGDHDSFIDAYSSLPPSKVGEIDTSAWMNAAELLISLCRASALWKYRVPTSLFEGNGSLPGFYSGYVELSDDPSCASAGEGRCVEVA